jgi:hypothetical protein
MSSSRDDERSKPGRKTRKVPTKRELQAPIGPRDADGTWLSGDDEDDPLREEAAERAARAVEPGKPRE